jgi:hypothetical protein
MPAPGSGFEIIRSQSAEIGRNYILDRLSSLGR